MALGEWKCEIRDEQEKVVEEEEEEKGGFRDGEEVGSKTVVVDVVSSLASDMEIGNPGKDVFPCCSLDGTVSSIRDLGFPASPVVEAGGGSNLVMANGRIGVVREIPATTGSSGPVIAADLICTYSGTWPGFTQDRVVKRLCGRSRTKAN